MFRRARIILFGLSFLAFPAAARGQQPDQFERLRLLDARVLTVGTRLSVRNLPLCPDRQWQTGFLIHHLSQYGRNQQGAVASAFRLSGGAGVLALADGGAGARAGLLLDDEILAADGTALPFPPPGVAGNFAPTERIIDALEAAFADGAAELDIRRGGTPQRIAVTADAGCASRFQVAPDTRLDAKADGRYVQLSSAMVEFAQDDEELAAFVAHELAHNILRHRARLDAAGVRRGFLAPFGRSGRLFRETEIEADRVAVHLMARAGYDPHAAVRLWTRQSRSDARLFEGTHPRWSERIEAMAIEIQAIEAARARGGQASVPLIQTADQAQRP